MSREPRKWTESPKYYLGKHTPDPSRSFRLRHLFRKSVTIYPRSAPGDPRCFFQKSMVLNQPCTLNYFYFNHDSRAGRPSYLGFLNSKLIAVSKSTPGIIVVPLDRWVCKIQKTTRRNEAVSYSYFRTLTPRQVCLPISCHTNDYNNNNNTPLLPCTYLHTLIYRKKR